MPNQDEFGFWDADPDWSDADSTSRVARPARVVDRNRERTMFWRRTGAMVVVGLIAVPIAMALRGSDPSPHLSTTSTALEPAVAIDTTPVALDAVTVAPVLAAGAAGEAAVVPVLAPDVLGAAAVGAQNIETASTAKSSTARTSTCTKRYTVATGDYWIMIAHNQSVALKDLLAANGATIATPLYTGRTVCLPANAKLSSSTSSTSTTVPKTTTTTKRQKSTTTTTKVTASTAKPSPAKATATTVKATTTTVAPSTTAAPPKNTYTRAQAEQIIRDVWPDDLEDKAVGIATRESNLIPTVRNSCCFGLFQIYFTANKSTLVAAGITSQAMLFDPRVNATAAYLLYLRSGWSPWGG